MDYSTDNLQQTLAAVTKENGEESVVVKGAIPKSLKLRFKICCVQKDVEMSQVLEELIERWIQADAPVPASINLSNEDTENVKGYIPKSLKLQFKTLCTQKQVKMRCVLSLLIESWVLASESQP